jgi:16S rRNA (adenine1518-N6/adenine1519-N6)-dimethyltransferase
MNRHHFKKQFGQNFLRNDKFVHKLLAPLDLSEGDTVIEIGPGDGRVTNQLLAKGVNVIGIEVDYSLIVALIKRFGTHERFKLINADVLEVDIPELVSAVASYKVTGSLPYNISKKIIARFMNMRSKPEIMSFVLQEEVSQAYSAHPPQATFLSNWLGLQAEVKKLESIPASQFFPVPKVNGGILTIVPSEDTYNIKELNEIIKLIKIAFGQPRKTLWNNMRSSGKWDEGRLRAAFEKLAFSPTIRAAQLSISQWRELYATLA